MSEKEGSAVMEAPTKYAKSDGIHIAYRVFGSGPRDIVLVPGLMSHVEFFWEYPPYKYMLGRLTSFARVIVFDKRGQGLSDRVAEQTLEERTGDLKAVMDAVGSSKASICGWSKGGAMSLMFGATYPERTSGLVLIGCLASVREMGTAEEYQALLENVGARWGEGVMVPLVAPSKVNDEAFVRWHARLERETASPGAILSLMRANAQFDIGYILPSIHLPTLILHRVGDKAVPVRAGRYLAKHIAGSRYVELPGNDHLSQAFEQEVLDHLIDEIEEFITGTRHRPEPDRILTTVMFTDITGSTERAAAVGDRQWRDLLASYYETVRKELATFRGRDVNTAGDGWLATFDGPARAIRCACAIRERLKPFALRVHTGLHTGECELVGDDVTGLAVHIGARIAATAGPEEVLVSSIVKELVAGSGIQFADRGSQVLKGVPGEWHLFAVQ